MNRPQNIKIIRNLFIIICSFADDIARSLLDLHINFADVFADNADADELNSTEEAQHKRKACHARDRFAREVKYQPAAISDEMAATVRQAAHDAAKGKVAER